MVSEVKYKKEIKDNTIEKINSLKFYDYEIVHLFSMRLYT